MNTCPKCGTIYEPGEKRSCWHCGVMLTDQASPTDPSAEHTTHFLERAEKAMHGPRTIPADPREPVHSILDPAPTAQRPTPETDAATFDNGDSDGDLFVVPADFARKLERERDELAELNEKNWNRLVEAIRKGDEIRKNRDELDMRLKRLICAVAEYSPERKTLRMSLEIADDVIQDCVREDVISEAMRRLVEAVQKAGQ